MQFSLASALLGCLVLTASVCAAPTEVSPRQSTVRIMALGDSITGSPVSTYLDLRLKHLPGAMMTDDSVGLLESISLAEAAGRWYQEHRFRGNVAGAGVWFHI